jgi:hypothetical protein
VLIPRISASKSYCVATESSAVTCIHFMGFKVALALAFLRLDSLTPACAAYFATSVPTSLYLTTHPP